MEKEYTVTKLTYKQLILLDGQVSESNQKIIDEARQGHEMGFAFEPLGHIMFQALNEGKLQWSNVSVGYCEFCGRKQAYYPWARKSHNHKKGAPNFDRPIHFGAVRFHGYAMTMCLDCVNEHDAINTLLQTIVAEELPVEIPTRGDFKTLFRRLEYLKCVKCDEERLEPEFSRDGKCPACGYSPPLFAGRPRRTGKIEMVRIAEGGSTV